MWARVVEVMLGLWLAISWLIFGYREASLLINDFTIAFLICLFSLLSYLPRFQKMHLFNFLIGVWFIILAYMMQGSLFYVDQNYMILGILFLMISILPSHAKYPPRRWIQFMIKKKND